MLAKDPLDKKGKRFNFNEYWIKNWDNMLVTLLLTIIWIILGPQIFEMYSDKLWLDLIYLASPMFCQKVIEYIKKFVNNNTKL